MTTVEQRNPATGETIGAVQSVSGSVVAEVVAKARAAQHVWAALSFRQRAKYLQRIKSYLVSHLDEACDVISRSTGKLRQDALATEVMPCVMACDWYANNTAQVLKPQRLPSGSILFANKTNELQYVPVGVVGIISPWNYPFSIPFGEVLMALMAGNAVLLKVAANTALVGSFIESCIAAAELPPHLFTHLIVSGAEVGPAFLNAGINKLFFTGSVRVGKQLMAEAAKTLTPLSLELGGNDPMIVLDDASIERAVNCACWAGFQNAGQSCGGVERIYVQRGIYDAFLAQLIRKTKALRHGPECGLFNVDVGSMTTKGQYDTVQTQLSEALAGGAQIVAQSQAVGDCTRGMFIPATVLVGCTAEMSVLRDETFGPLLPVMVFDTEDEVVGLANACTLALTSSVFSGNAKRAKKLAARLESGVVSINDHLYTHGMSEAPWGGWKESGLGRTHGYLGLKEMSNVKCINTDCASGILPRNLWWYPFDADSFRLLTAAVHFVAPQGVCDWFSSVAYIVGHCGRMFTSWKVE